MAVTFTCIYCGKPINSDFVFEGKFSELAKFTENKTKELSDKCECRIGFKK